ncbi:MAG: hypothetical protein Fur0010_13760 [Bdellovibrio sp.]
MSESKAREWLLSHHNNEYRKNQNHFRLLTGKAKTIAIASGKGGVGKTSVSIKVAKILSEQGYRVLLVDCDYNLSNTAVKLGLPLDDKFNSFVNSALDFESTIYRDGQFHLLKGCNGNNDLFDNDDMVNRILFQVVVQQENNFDFIIFDCPAGLVKENLAICAYCDYRMVVLAPDRSSITDAYSLVKILHSRFGVNDFHLVLNKISNQPQYQRLVKAFSDTVNQFLNCRVRVLGGVKYFGEQVDRFDQELLKTAGTELHDDFLKIIKSFTDEFLDVLSSEEASTRRPLSGMGIGKATLTHAPFRGSNSGHEVRTNHI